MILRRKRRSKAVLLEVESDVARRVLSHAYFSCMASPKLLILHGLDLQKVFA